jgi:hypothetical protein
MRAFLLLPFVVAASALVPSEAHACRCVPTDVVQATRRHEHALVAWVKSVRTTRTHVLHDVVVRHTATSCLPVGETITVASPIGACTTRLPLRVSTLVFGDTAWIGGRRVVVTDACSGNRPATSLTPDEVAFLASRTLTCEGVTRCADGTLPNACLLDPCDVSTCADPDAVCESSYCGGCVAEWYAPDDLAVCTPW